MKDEELIYGIQNDKNINKYIEYLYKHYFMSIRKLIKEKNGSEQDAEDMMLESVRILIEIVRQGHFRKEASIKTFLYRVASNLWIDELRKRKGKEQAKHGTQVEKKTEELNLPIGDKQVRSDILKIMENIGDDCKDLLMLFFFHGYSYQEILELPEYKERFSTVKALSNQKLRCWSKLIKMLEDYKRNIDSKRTEGVDEFEP